MKQFISIILVLGLCLFLFGCTQQGNNYSNSSSNTSGNSYYNGNNNYSGNNGNQNSNNSGYTQGSNSSFIGSWVSCGVDEGDMKLTINQSTVTLSSGGESMTLSYTAASNSRYSFLLLDTPDGSMALVMVEDGLIGMIREYDYDLSEYPFEHRISVGEKAFNGNFQPFVKSGTGTNTWPLNDSMENVLGYSSVSVRYYSNAGLLFFNTNGHVSALYVYDANSYTFVSSICLLGASGISDAVQTNHNFCITDWT